MPPLWKLAVGFSDWLLKSVIDVFDVSRSVLKTLDNAMSLHWLFAAGEWEDGWMVMESNEMYHRIKFFLNLWRHDSLTPKV